jgi:hypothetical protein
LHHRGAWPPYLDVVGRVPPAFVEGARCVIVHRGVRIDAASIAISPEALGDRDERGGVAVAAMLRPDGQTVELSEVVPLVQLDGDEAAERMRVV